MSTPKELVSAKTHERATRIRHPKNPNSEVLISQLSDLAGLSRTAVSIATIPPGKESFIPHAHFYQEEWVYILSGHGKALIGNEHHDVGPGDFLGFRCDGTVHHLINDRDDNLVYLQGGERSGADLARFPTLNKIGIPFLEERKMAFVDEDALETLPFSAWMVDED